jgi:hypothetical protein
MWRHGLPNRPGIDELHRHWFETGVAIVVDTTSSDATRPTDRPAED